MIRLLILTGLLSLSQCAAEAQSDFASELPRIPPSTPSEALKSFQVADGFQLQLVASEPLIATPVAIEWAADGSLFVCEMRGYSEDKDEAISRITRLVDDDQDGVFDRRTIYADGLLWPTGLMPYDGGLFVGDAPNLLYFKDLDGDGVSDRREVILTGFGTSNVQGLMNSFRWDLDNRIHIACSSVGGLIRRPDQPEKQAINVRGRDIALDPKTNTFTLTSGAAQHGMCFDDWGTKFVSSNSNHLQQVMYEDRYVARNPQLRAPPSRISIASDGPQAEVYRTSPVEPWRIVRTRLRVGGLVPGPVEGGGRAAGYFTGATGVTIYRGDAWPDKWKGYAIVGDVGSNLVHRKSLTPNGLEMIGHRVDDQSEFITSRDIWFRPAQFANAPDGTLHIIDVCREVIEHPKSLPPDIKKHLDLTSGRDRGRIYRIAPSNFQYRTTPNLESSSIPELVSFLEHANAWHREASSKRLYELQDSTATPLLKQLANDSSNPLGRLHAMYALDGLESLDESVILPRLKDPHPRVRTAAIRLSERIPTSQQLRRRLVSLQHDESIHVRYQLAFTVGSIADFDPTSTLAGIIRQNADDRWIQTAVQSSAVSNSGKLLKALALDSEFRSSNARLFLVRLANQVMRERNLNAWRVAVSGVTSLPRTDAEFALPILGELLRSPGRVFELESQDLAKLAKAESVLDQYLATQVALATDEQAKLSERVAAIQRLSNGRLSTVASPLESLISNRQPDEIQQAAIRTLGGFQSTDIVAPLLSQWKGLSPSLRGTAAEVLFSRSDRLLLLLDAVERGDLSKSELPPALLRIALQSNNAEVRKRVSEFVDVQSESKRSEIVERYRRALDLPADVDRGKTVFRKHCANCHKVQDYGHELGPNLATIKTRGPETILVNVLDPNREVNPEFLNYVVLTEDGRTLSGMIAGESASSITLKRAESATNQVLRQEIETLKSTGMSLMPEGMEDQVDVQSMADLIGYLMSL